MSSRPVKTFSINVRPHTLLVIQRAARLYSNIAAGRYKIYDQPLYRFFEIDHDEMRDTALELKELAADLTFRIQRDAR